MRIVRIILRGVCVDKDMVEKNKNGGVMRSNVPKNAHLWKLISQAPLGLCSTWYLVQSVGPTCCNTLSNYNKKEKEQSISFFSYGIY